MREVKIFGERNTATNALKTIIETNSSTRVAAGTSLELHPPIADTVKFWKRLRDKLGRTNALGRYCEARLENRIDRVFEHQPPIHLWKHAATYVESVEMFRNVPVFFCVRHPLSWLVSLHKNAYHSLSRVPDSLKDFAVMPWRTVKRENLGEVTTTPIDLYGIKLDSYRSMIGKLASAGFSYQVIHFEDIVLRQEAVFTTLGPYLDGASLVFEPLETSTKSSSKDLSYYQRYYSEERWRPEAVEVAGIARERLPRELMDFFEYEIGL